MTKLEEDIDLELKKIAAYSNNDVVVNQSLDQENVTSYVVNEDTVQPKAVVVRFVISTKIHWTFMTYPRSMDRKNISNFMFMYR